MDVAPLATIRYTPPDLRRYNIGSTGADDRPCLSCGKNLLGPKDRIHSFCNGACLLAHFSKLPHRARSADPWAGRGGYLLGYCDSFIAPD